MIGVESIGQFVMMNDGLVRKMMNVNGLKTKMEVLGMYCHPIKPIPQQKKNIASTRSFGQDIDSFDRTNELTLYSFFVVSIELDNVTLVPWFIFRDLMLSVACTTCCKAKLIRIKN